MSQRFALGDVALSGALGAGTHNSPALGAPGAVADVLLMVHVTAASGTSPTLTVSVQESADGVTWTAVPGGAAAALTAAGSATANVAVTQAFARVSAVIGGTTPSFTFRASVLVFTA